MRVCSLSCLLFLVAAHSVQATDHWAEFRGPNGTGLAPGADLPIEFSDSKNVTWKTAIHGWGHSSPVVWGDQIWMTTATEDGLKMSAVCVNTKTGKIVYDLLLIENESVSPDQHAANSFASCTPVIEEGRVYCHFGHYGTFCIDTKTGKVLWQRRDIVVDEYRGPASSPILFENLLIVNCDGVDVQFVLALDKRTGKTVWKTDRTIDYGTEVGDLKKGYGTPSLIKVNGQLQLVSPTAVETITYDPRTGQELWRVRHGGMNAAARPLEHEGLVYIAAGKDDSSLVVVKPGKGDLTKSGVAWKSGKGVSQKPSPLLIDGKLFMIGDSGVASCRDAKTGDIIWQERIGGDFWASPVSNGQAIYCFSKEGKVPVFAASDEFKLLAENQFPEGFHSTPAIVGDTMFVRSRHHLYRIEKN